MQARLASVVQRGSPLPALAQRCRRSSFIKQVMEQVKRDMEQDERLKKDWQKVQQSSERLRKPIAQSEEKIQNLGEQLKSMSARTSEILSDWRRKVDSTTSSASSRMSETTENNEALKKARDFMRSGMESGAAGSKTVLNRGKDIFGGIMDTTSKAFSYMGDESQKADKMKAWKAARESAAAQAAGEEQTAEAGEQAQDKANGTPAPEQEADNALVVSKASSSSWDRFGAGLRDMPFLSSVFDNPLFERLFGESEIAASIREMKQIDPTFRLEDFAEDIEYIVVPHIIRTYLEGDSKALETHCGEAAFQAVNASIKARKQQKLSLDTAILAGPKELELKGAKLMEQGAPCFIWTFTMQQVNCLRNSAGEIIEGAVDDIRTVCYAMVITRHPELEKSELEYPWQVSELAILWNQPCF